MILSFTGHRYIGYDEIPRNIYNYVFKKTLEFLTEHKPEKCISGMAVGYDQLAVEICLELKISYIAAIPFIGQEKFWSNYTKEKYKEYLNYAEKIVYVSEPGYAVWKMQKRNIWMVDNSDEVLACFDNSLGGTANCIDYAFSRNKIINPNRFSE